MKALVATFNQEKALVGAFSVITNLRMDFFEALFHTALSGRGHDQSTSVWVLDNFIFALCLFIAAAINTSNLLIPDLFLMEMSCIKIGCQPQEKSTLDTDYVVHY